MMWDVVGTVVLLMAVYLLYKRGGFAAFGSNRVTDLLVVLLMMAAFLALLWS
jgi:hypothetical protein